MLLGNCTFNIEGIPICDGGTLVCVTKAALDYIEVAVHQDDSSCVPNTNNRRLRGILVIVESGLFEDGNLSEFWIQDLLLKTNRS